MASGFAGGGHLEDGLGVGAVEAEVEFFSFFFGELEAGDELVEGAVDLFCDERAFGRVELALDFGGEECSLSDAAGLRGFNGGLHGLAEGFLFFGELIDVGNAVGGVVEGVAFGGDPGHLGGFSEEDLVVGEGRLHVLALEDRGEDGEEFYGLFDAERVGGVEFSKERGRLGGDGVLRGCGDAADGGLELGREALGVELAEEELGDLFGVVGLGVGAAGHLEALEGVDAVEGVAEWAKDAGDGFLSSGEAAHALKGDGADGAVVVEDLAAFAEGVVGVGFCGGNADEQVFEEEHVEGLREDGAGDLRAGVGGDLGMDDEELEEVFGAVGTDDLGECFA